MSDMGELIARLEKATGPDRDLDIEIARATLNQDGWRITDSGDLECYGEMDPEHGPDWYPSGAELPEYTRSMDAAVALVPEGYDWRVGQYRKLDAGRANAVVTTPALAAWNWDTGADAANPALALCIAALKARSA